MVPRRGGGARVHLRLGAVDATRPPRQQARPTVGQLLAADAQARAQSGPDGKGVDDGRRRVEAGRQKSVLAIGGWRGQWRSGGRPPAAATATLRPEAGIGGGRRAAGKFADGELHDNGEKGAA